MASIPTTPHTFATLATACAVLGIAASSLTIDADARPTHGEDNVCKHGRLRNASRKGAFCAILALCDDSTLAKVEAGSLAHCAAVATAVPGIWRKADEALAAGNPAAIPGIMARVAETCAQVLAGWASAYRWDWESVPCIPALAGRERSHRAEAAAKAEAERVKAEAKAAAEAKAEAEAAAKAKPAPRPTLAKGFPTVETIKAHMAQAGTSVARKSAPAWNGRKVA